MPPDVTTVAPGADNLIGEKPQFVDQPPRLITAINRLHVLPDREASDERLGTKLPEPPAGADSLLGPHAANYVLEIVNHILGGFTQAELDNAWSTDAGKERHFGEPADILEERWAAKVAEMFTMSAYGGPDFTANLPLNEFPEPGTKGDVYTALRYIYQRLQLYSWPEEFWSTNPVTKAGAKALDNTDPAYSLVTACQQLSTYFLTSRGFTIEEHMKGSGVTAGNNSSCELFTEKFGGSWLTGQNEDNIHLAITKFGLTPGSSYCYSSGDGVQSTGSHIWSVLRIEPTAKLAGGRRRAQNFEGEGADQYPTYPAGATKNPVPRAASYGTHGAGRWESTWKEFVGVTGLCGLGVAPRPNLLEAAIGMIDRARPVGLARLVIARRRSPPPGEVIEPTGPADVIFISRFARMWDDDEEVNYAPSRFLLSLRNTPYYADLKAFWFLYAPRAELASVMWKSGARDKSVEDLFRLALKKMEENGVGATALDLEAQLALTHVISHDSQGCSRFAWRFHSLSSPELTEPTGLAAALYRCNHVRDAVGMMPGFGTTRWDGQYLHPALGGADAVKLESFFAQSEVTYTLTPTPPKPVESADET